MEVEEEEDTGPAVAPLWVIGFGIALICALPISTWLYYLWLRLWRGNRPAPVLNSQEEAPSSSTTTLSSSISSSHPQPLPTP